MVTLCKDKKTCLSKSIHLSIF